MARRARSEETQRREQEKYNELQHRLVLETFEQPLLTHEEEIVLGRKVELMTHLEERIAQAKEHDDAYCAIMLLRETAQYRDDADLAWQALSTRGKDGSPTIAEICGDAEFRREIDCRAVPENNKDAKRIRHEEKRRRIGETHDGRVVLLSVVSALTPPFLFNAASRIAWETGATPREDETTLHHIWDCMNNPGTGAMIEDAAIRLNDSIAGHFQQIIKEGQDAVNELSERNTRLVMSIAQRYTYRDLDITDLFQEGSMGLIKAIYRYDYRRGYKFSTYATWWIRQAVSRNLGNERNIRLPDGVSADLRKMARIEAMLAQKYGTENISPADIALEMDQPVDKILELRKLKADTQSLDEHITDRDGEQSATTRADLIPQPGPSTEELSLNNVVSMELRSIMEQTLSPDEITLLMHEFSFNERAAIAPPPPRNRRAQQQAMAKLKQAMARIGITQMNDIMPVN